MVKDTIKREILPIRPIYFRHSNNTSVTVCELTVVASILIECVPS